MTINRRHFIRGASVALALPTLILPARRAHALELVGLAQRFDIEKYWNGPVEADFLHGLDNQLKVIHQAASAYGNDVAEATATAASPNITTVLSRAPQATMLRYPYAFESRHAKAMMTGTPNSAHGHSFVWGRGGGADATWYQMNGSNPVLYEATGAWASITNNPMIELPDGHWLCMPEIGSGIGSALGTTFANIESGKSSGVVIAGAGNGAMQLYRDTHVVLWCGMRDSSFGLGTSTWFTTIATAAIADILSAPGNSANWTVHSGRFAIGYKDKHMCDPAPYDGPDGGRLLVSYDQAGLLFLRSAHSLTDLYAELIG